MEQIDRHGFLSQMGYVVAYGLAGLFADGIADTLQIGVGRGAAIVIMVAGMLQGVTGLCVSIPKSIWKLERSNV